MTAAFKLHSTYSLPKAFWALNDGLRDLCLANLYGEVLGLGVMDDDGGGALLGDHLHVFGEGDAYPE